MAANAGIDLYAVRAKVEAIGQLMLETNQLIEAYFASLPTDGSVSVGETATLNRKLERLHQVCEWSNQDLKEILAGLKTHSQDSETTVL